ncbi:MAG: radical SAM protein [Thermodesulforhabdaceae bacterium]
MGTCRFCNKTHPEISSELSLCAYCIRQKPEDALAVAAEVHKSSRKKFRLLAVPPKTLGGVACKVCLNACVIGEGELGYCGLRKNIGGKLSPEFELGKLSFYHDPLPTNCVADWVCPGGTGSGYPKYAYKRGPEYGYKNLAIFFHTCSFNCLFCQNWHFKEELHYGRLFAPEDMGFLLDEATSCICFFGGDPSSQMPFSIAFSKFALEKRKGKILRICFETNGSMNEKLLDEAFDLVLESGGCIKFDLKVWDENLHKVLTGQSNKTTLKNFARLAERIKERPEPPPLVASTLLVPGYVTEEEVENIARFIADLNPDIPYALLAFYPQFYFHDLPVTRRETALRCKEVAIRTGLKNVRLGNIHLLR